MAIAANRHNGKAGLGAQPQAVFEKRVLIHAPPLHGNRLASVLSEDRRVRLQTTQQLLEEPFARSLREMGSRAGSDFEMQGCKSTEAGFKKAMKLCDERIMQNELLLAKITSQSSFSSERKDNFHRLIDGLAGIKQKFENELCEYLKAKARLEDGAKLAKTISQQHRERPIDLFVVLEESQNGSPYSLHIRYNIPFPNGALSQLKGSVSALSSEISGFPVTLECEKRTTRPFLSMELRTILICGPCKALYLAAPGLAEGIKRFLLRMDAINENMGAVTTGERYAFPSGIALPYPTETALPYRTEQ